MATMYQVKVHGKWRDIQLSWVSLAMIENAIRRDGGEAVKSKLNEESMKPFLEMAKEAWGDKFKESMVVTVDGLSCALAWDCVMVLIHRQDTLRIGVCWEMATQLPSTLKADGSAKENWLEEEGFVEFTILPGN